MTPVKTYIANVLTAGAVALAAITSGTAPAEARDRDKQLLGALAGVALGAIIVGTIDQNNARNQRAPRYVQPQPQPRYVQPQPQALQHYSFQQQDDGYYAGDRRWVNEDQRRGPRLPAACALEVGNGAYPTVYYAESCLRREGVGYGLPQYCAERIRGRDYDGRVFEESCMREAGYRSDRWN